MKPPPKSTIVIIVSANIEWQAVRSVFEFAEVHASALGEWFMAKFPVGRAINLFSFTVDGARLQRRLARYVADGDSRRVAWSPACQATGLGITADLKKIYQAAAVLEAEQELENFSAK